MLGPKATCEWCNTEYRMATSRQRFCSDKCRNDFHNREKKVCLVAAAEAIASGKYQPTDAQREAASKFVPGMRRRA